MAAQNSFFRHFVKREPAPRREDPADLGTAFGLDASLSTAGDFDAGDEADARAHSEPEQAPMDWLAQRRKPRR